MNETSKTIIVFNLTNKNCVEVFNENNPAITVLANHGIATLLQASLQNVPEDVYTAMSYEIATELAMIKQATILDVKSFVENEIKNNPTSKILKATSNTEDGYDESKKLVKTDVSLSSENKFDDDVTINTFYSEKLDTYLVEEYVNKLESIVEQYLTNLTDDSVTVLANNVNLSESDIIVNQIDGAMTIITKINPGEEIKAGEYESEFGSDNEEDEEDSE